MLSNALVRQILHDERVVRGLADPEARYMVEWLVDRGEDLSVQLAESCLPGALNQLRLRARAIGRFLYLWCYEKGYGAAAQLAAVERFQWPMPVKDVDPCSALAEILYWENQVISQSTYTNSLPKAS